MFHHSISALPGKDLKDVFSFQMSPQTTCHVEPVACKQVAG